MFFVLVYVCFFRRIDLKVKIVFVFLFYLLDLVFYNNLLFERKRLYGYNEMCFLIEIGDDDFMVLIFVDDEVIITVIIYLGRKSEGLILFMYGFVLVFLYF